MDLVPIMYVVTGQFHYLLILISFVYSVRTFAMDDSMKHSRDELAKPHKKDLLRTKTVKIIGPIVIPCELSPKCRPRTPSMTRQRMLSTL